MNTDQGRTISFIIISVVILFGWQYFFGDMTNKNKAPELTVNNQVAQGLNNKVQEPGTANAPTTTTRISDTTTKQKSNIKSQKTVPLKLTNIPTANGHFEFDNYLGLKQVKRRDSLYTFDEIIGRQNPFHIEVFYDGSFQRVPIDWYFQQNGVFKGQNKNLGIDLNISVGEKEELHLTLNSTKKYKYRFVFQTTPESLNNGQNRDYILLNKEVERISVGDTERGDGPFSWIGIDFRYHLLAFVFPERVLASYYTTEKGYLVFNVTADTNHFVSKIYFTKKNYDYLKTLGHNLSLAVDFGFLGVIAVPILKSLKFFYEVLPNYGLAIILLTLIIRLLTFPLQYKSFKSMKKMQVLQPELTKLREKYKEDPQRLQRESMELFKRAGANPLGGCLPLLLQMPIFFAFYKVLNESVELVGSPFFGWISDLSLKDPFYVLPILMAVSMLLQQKFTPTPTADPTQKKIMYFMPIIFGFIMKDLPAGLSLYIFVSTILGIFQQFIVYKYN